MQEFSRRDPDLSRVCSDWRQLRPNNRPQELSKASPNAAPGNVPGNVPGNDVDAAIAGRESNELSNSTPAALSPAGGGGGVSDAGAGSIGGGEERGSALAVRSNQCAACGKPALLKCASCKEVRESEGAQGEAGLSLSFSEEEEEVRGAF